jgi:hypothetical protein
MRRRFDYQGRKYLVQMRVETVLDVWRGCDASGNPIILCQGSSGPVLEIAGERVELARAD